MKMHGLTLHIAASYPRELQRRLLADALGRLGETPRGDTLNERAGPAALG